MLQRILDAPNQDVETIWKAATAAQSAGYWEIKVDLVVVSSFF